MSYLTLLKSATDNIGTFDGANSDIRYSRKSRQRNQINPVIVDGVVQEQFQYLLREYGWCSLYFALRLHSGVAAVCFFLLQSLL